MAARARARRRGAILGAVALVAALAALWPLGPALVVRRTVARPDAILSLASHEWERLPLAARLAAASPDALVLLTVPGTVTDFNCDDCPHRLDRLRELGVAPGRVRELRASHPGTYGEALAVAAFAGQAGIRSIVVCTSSYHTRRSLAVFRKVFEGTGIDVGVEPAAITPQPDRGKLSRYPPLYVAYEWSAIVYYWWRYGVPIALPDSA